MFRTGTPYDTRHASLPETVNPWPLPATAWPAPDRTHRPPTTLDLVRERTLRTARLLAEARREIAGLVTR